MSWVADTATDFADLLVRQDSFLVDHGHSLPPAYTGTGTGWVSQVLGTATTVQETITVAFTSATEFTVAGSVTGAMGTGVQGTAFAHARLGFLVSAGGTAWASGDTISWVMTPPWVRCRLIGGAHHRQSTTFDLAKVVDGDAATYCSLAAADLPQWGGMQMLKAIEVRSLRIAIAGTPGKGPRDYALVYSDDGGATYSVAASWTVQTWTQANEQRLHDVPASGNHLGWYLRVTAANGTTAEIASVTFYRATGGAQADAIPWFGEAIWRAPGNGNENQIYLGAKLKWNAVGAYWCWRLAGFAGYVEGNAFDAQPGYNGGHGYLTLWDAAIPYWFIADGKCFKVLPKISAQYEHSYLGFMDNYQDPGSYPYPVLVGGSMGFQDSADPGDISTSYRYAVADETHRAWWSPGGDVNSHVWGTASFRRVDGVWKSIAGNNQSADPVGSLLAYWWPCANRGSLPQMTDLRLNLDGSVPLMPLLLHDAGGVVGEPDGVAVISGNNQSTENLVVVNRIPWLVLQNIARCGVQDFVAYRLS